MRPFSRRIIWLVPTMLTVLGLTLGTVLAHEGREVGEYRFNVGWVDEPAYEGFKNGVEVRVTKVAQGNGMPSEHAEQSLSTNEEGDHHGDDDGDESDEGMSMESEGDHHGDGDDENDSSMSEDEGRDQDASVGMDMGQEMGGQHGGGTPVASLEETLQVEVTYVTSEASRVLDLYADPNEPGRYTAALIPTTPGVYQFRVFGEVEGTPVDQAFLSKGAGGGFDDIRPSTSLQFPEQLSGPRELASAVRGALNTAQQAQDAALAASSEDDNDGSDASILTIVAIVLGALGLASGVGGAVFALKRR